MKQFGFLCIFVSILSVGFGVYLIVVSAMKFIPEPFTVCRLAVGSIWSLAGATLFFAATKLIVTEREEKTLDDKEKNNGAR